MPDISPTSGEIGCPSAFANFQHSRKGALSPKPPISPLSEEMSGRTEGGAVPPTSMHQRFTTGP
ncbi:MAG: propionyl-coenzyme A carboxylase alpha polypeptide [Mesorhizobium sp.]|nr:MAG: propionyl-coenzyme A carboxylase alpha polypeptide [Mesorhizobium sp.]